MRPVSRVRRRPPTVRLTRTGSYSLGSLMDQETSGAARGARRAGKGRMESQPPGNCGLRTASTGRRRSGAGADAADAQLVDQGVVAAGVGTLQVAQQPVAPADELQEPSAGRVVLGVGLQVLGERQDPLGE